MKQIKILQAIAITFGLLLFSCGGEEAKTTDSTVTNTPATDTSATSATTGSEVTTTPETIIVVKHQVTNYAKWKAAYDAHDSLKLAHGIRNYRIGRSVEDSNMLLVAVKADDVNKVKALIQSNKVRQGMKKAGVIGTPTVSVINFVYQDRSKDLSPLRSMTHLTVKDWDTWKTVFESNRQVRLDNGLKDRGYGHEVDDNSKVTIVLGITDSAKAYAFWHSELIKQRQSESGVTRVANRIVYRIVQRY